MTILRIFLKNYRSRSCFKALYRNEVNVFHVASMITSKPYAKRRTNKNVKTRRNIEFISKLILALRERLAMGLQKLVRG